jgi:hypothetical protein
MDTYQSAIFLGWLALSVVTGVVAARRGGNGPRWFLLALVCSPILGLAMVSLLAHDQRSGTYRPASARARVATWILAFTAALFAATFVLNVVAANTGDASEDTLSGAIQFLAGFGVLAVIGSAIAFLVWLSRAIDNLPPTEAEQPGMTPRWSIAWWFIPIANLGMPYEIVRSLRNQLMGESERKHPILLLGWWITFVVGLLLLFVAGSVDGAIPPRTDVSQPLATIGFGLLALAGVLAILVVRGIDRAETRLALRSVGETEAASMPADGPGLQGLRMRSSWVGFLMVTCGFVAVAAGVVLATPASGAPGQTAASLLPHQDAQLERMMPTSVAGEQLVAWSYRGADYFTDVAGLSQADVADARAALAQGGLDLDQMGFAMDGRASTDDDPYFVVAISLGSGQASQVPLGMFIDYADAGVFTPELVGGKRVDVGVTAMFDQTEHLRGLPYVYSAGTVRYIVVTDDPAWAEDALRQLP